MNRKAVGYQILATRWKPDEKEPKRYPSMIMAVFLMKSPEWVFWISLKMKTTSWIVWEARESSRRMRRSHQTQSLRSLDA
jgi:hypothetical protein